MHLVIESEDGLTWSSRITDKHNPDKKFLIKQIEIRGTATDAYFDCEVKFVEINEGDNHEYKEEVQTFKGVITEGFKLEICEFVSIKEETNEGDGT